MTAEQLKASVLQMAIEGKLVPQLDDEPAVDIEAVEPEEVPFAIPEKWKWVFLKDISLSISDGHHNPPANSGCGIPVASAKNISSGVFDFAKIDRWTTEEEWSLQNKRNNLEKGDVLLVIVGATLGRVAIYNSDQKVMFQRSVCMIKPLENYLYSEFLQECIRTPAVQAWIQENAAGSAQKGIYLKSLQKMPIPIPPKAEQERILARLNEILPLIEEYGKAHSALKNAEQALPDQLRASLLQEAIQGKLVPQLDDEPAVDMAGEEPDEVPFAIPEKWKWVRLSDVGNFISGRTPKPAELAETGEIPYFKVSDMNTVGNEINLTITNSYLKERPKKVYTAGTIVYPKNGGAVFTNKRRILVRDSIVDLNTGGFVPGGFLNLEYAFKIFLALDFRKISKGTALPTIDQEQLRNYLIPLPPLAEQRRIVARLEELLPHVDAIAGLR